MNRGRSTMLRGAGLALVALISVSGCGSGSEPTADEPVPPVSPVSPGTSAPSKPSNQPNPCIGDPVGTETPPNSGPETDGYLGLTVAEAEQYAADQYQTIRVAGRDGRCFALTADYRDNRVNLYLEDDVVVAAAIG